MTGAILKWKDREKQTESGWKQVPLSQYLKKTTDFKLKQVRRHKDRHAILTKGNN